VSHYFIGSSPDAPLSRVMVEWGGHKLDWTVAPGIFSTSGLDEGSRLLLDSIAVAPGQWLLDMGCGSGPLGLLPQLGTPDLTSVLVDVNPTAVRCARENARNLRLERTLVVLADGPGAIRPGRFDVALTNPPIRAGRKVVEEILRGSLDSLRVGGSLYMVVRVQQGGWTLAERAGVMNGSPAVLVKRRKGYLVFRCVKG
jgi:16S rRNA (guanine1207-N2)-methyltransferase